MDSDADDEEDIKVKTEDVDDDIEERSRGLLSPDDAVQSGELAEGVRKIKVSSSPQLFLCSPIFTNHHTAQTAALCGTDEPAWLTSKTR